MHYKGGIMSENTPCNIDTLKRIKEDAYKRNARVYIRSGYMGGNDIYVVPKGEKLDTSIDKKGNHGKQWVAWMWEI